MKKFGEWFLNLGICKKIAMILFVSFLVSVVSSTLIALSFVNYYGRGDSISVRNYNAEIKLEWCADAYDELQITKITPYAAVVDRKLKKASAIDADGYRIKLAAPLSCNGKRFEDVLVDNPSEKVTYVLSNSKYFGGEYLMKNPKIYIKGKEAYVYTGDVLKR